MMQKSVSNICFMNTSWLRVANIERLISAMPIRFTCKFPIKCDNVICQMERKFLDIFFIPFAFQKFPPGLQ